MIGILTLTRRFRSATPKVRHSHGPPNPNHNPNPNTNPILNPNPNPNPMPDRGSGGPREWRTLGVASRYQPVALTLTDPGGQW